MHNYIYISTNFLLKVPLVNIIGNCKQLANPAKRAKQAVVTGVTTANFAAVAGSSQNPISPTTSTPTPLTFGFEELEEDEVLPTPRHRRRQRVNYAVSIVQRYYLFTCYIHNYVFLKYICFSGSRR